MASPRASVRSLLGSLIRRGGRASQPQPMTAWRQTVRARLVVCAVAFGVWTAGIEARLVYLQVFEHADLMTRADRQQTRTLFPPAKRGEIVDRRGRLLAYSVDADSIAAVPTEIDDPEDVAAQVCRALDGCDADRRTQIVKNLSRKSSFAYIARQVSPEEAKRVRALALPGVTLFKESRRYYPNSELAAHVIGYVGLDNVGLGGIESAYDAQIRGKDGKVLIQTDNFQGKRRALSSRVERPATAGAGIELTIDEYLQHVAERELRAGVDANHAQGGTAIVMDPHTGEILALANWPTFNPNTFARADDDDRRNRAIQTLYEPGSTFKIVTASAALEQKVITPDTMIDTNPGSITFPGRKPIFDTHKYGVIDFTDVIVKSSNVGAIKVGLRVGPDVLTQYVNRFGFGQTLGPDFKGETAGIVCTAAKLVNGRYQKSDYNASFVGFIPSRKPVLTILVVIDSPHGNGYTGGAVSAPVFKRIAEAASTYLGIGPNLNAAPPVIVARHDTPEGDGAAAQPARAASVLAATLEPARNGLMPDLRGLSAREALRSLSRIGMTARLSGDGFVREQSPAPGEALVRGEACTLKLGRRAPAAPASGGHP
jgi:cell division protein FtsI/penicillin-binding protein 2